MKMLPIAALLSLLTLSACASDGVMAKHTQKMAELDALQTEWRARDSVLMGCIRNNKADLKIGMTQNDVLTTTCFTFVARTHRRTTAAHTYDQWVFEAYGARAYAHFTDGVLTSVAD